MDVDRAVQQAEWTLLPFVRTQATSEIELAVAVNEFLLACQKIIEMGPEVVLPLRNLVFSTEALSFNRAQTAARILAELPFMAAAQVLLEASLSPEPVLANRGLQALRCLPPSEAYFRMIMEAFNGAIRTGAIKRKKNLLVEALCRQTIPEFYQMAAQWTREHPDEYVRRTLVNTLVIDGSDKVAPILKVALEDSDEIVQIRAAFGLILAGEIEHLDRLIHATQARKVEIRAEAVGWVGLLPLPVVAKSVLDRLWDTSAKVQMVAISRAHDLGVREALSPLADLLSQQKMQVVEQAAAMLQSMADMDLPYKWDGRRLTSGSISAVRENCVQIQEKWETGFRYWRGRLITLTGLVSSLLDQNQAASAFWILVGMTGERFDYNPELDLIVNWKAFKHWRSWVKEHERKYQAGQWYHLGHLYQKKRRG